MKRPIVLAGQPFELVTTDWPFDDDEACCLELAEEHLRQLECLDGYRLDAALGELTDGPLEFELDRVLMLSLMEAAGDYETGFNGFECLLELRPLVTA
jgi:hypothetical protein